MKIRIYLLKKLRKNDSILKRTKEKDDVKHEQSFGKKSDSMVFASVILHSNN